MFNNLIESSSHAQEFKRRGSFLLFTTATYLVLFAITGVASIYAYDAHLEAQSTELEITFVPLRTTEEAPEPPPRHGVQPTSNPGGRPTESIRTELFDSASNPTHIPDKVGTVATDVPPANWNSKIGPTNSEPPSLFTSPRGVPGGTGNTPVGNLPDDPPPPPPPPPPAVPKVVKVSRVLNSQAIELPRPNYPPMARQIRLQGMVSVQVLIDEKGSVVSAKALSGHPLFVPEAQKAAMRARFSPTVISDQPVKVSGVITYNFVLNQ